MISSYNSTLITAMLLLILAMVAMASPPAPTSPPHHPRPHILSMSLEHSISKRSKYNNPLFDPKLDLIGPAETNYFNSKLFYVRAGIGIPLNLVYLVIDTSTSLLWVYCRDPYLSEYSTSYKPMPCGLGGECDVRNDNSVLGICDSGSHQCTYLQAYEGKINKGSLATETFRWGDEQDHLPDPVEGNWPDVVFGCATKDQVFDDWRADGVLGLGQGTLSFIAQNSHTMFGHCIGNITIFGVEPYLVDDHQLTIRTNLKVDSPSASETPITIRNGKYTVLLKNITFNGKLIGGNVDSTIYSGGMELDTTSSLTYLPESVAKELEDLTDQEMIVTIPKNYSVVHHGYSRIYTRLCYNGRMYVGSLNLFPEVKFIFDGDSVMNLELGNLFEQYYEDLFCLAIVPSEVETGKIVLGTKYDAISVHCL